MMCNSLRLIYLGAALVVLLAVPHTLHAQAQATTGVIRGNVYDPQGTPVVGAGVAVRETGTNFRREVRSGSGGAFVASLLPLGTYEVTVRAVGFQETQRTGIVVRVGETVELQINLGGAVTLRAIEVVSTPVEQTRVEAATRLPEEAVTGLPNNGRNFLNLTLLTPNVSIVQGPDGDELNIMGQRGIHNNVAVDGADFNNPFFGEQRGGQRAPFTFNLDAVQEIVVVSQGANAEFGRSSGGFVNVITKSGTNEFHGSAQYFGKFDALSAKPFHVDKDTRDRFEREPDFSQHQIGFTLGGPIVRDKAFFFLAYDQQVFSDTRQTDPNRIGNADLRAWVDTAFGGALRGDDGPIDRTDNARALLAKVDFRISDVHNASLKYNYTWSQQENGTFDVDTWLGSSNALEKDFSHAVNGSLRSAISSNISNEFRFQFSREDRPRPYLGPQMPGVAPPAGVKLPNRPFPDTGMDFASGFRFGMPFFIPVEYYDTRIQVLNNLSFAAGNHFIKVGAEWNRVNSVQTFIGFANGRMIFSSVEGFLRYVADGNSYVECEGDEPGQGNTLGGAAPCGLDGDMNPIAPVGPVLLYLQQAGVGGLSVEEAGTQQIPQHELALFIQDSWKPIPNLTLNYGLRWEAQIQPDVITSPDQVFFAPFIGQSSNGQEFPSDGTIQSDHKMFQPRLGFAWDINSDRKSVLRGSAGVYYARIPGLNLASTRSTNGSVGQTLFRNSELTGVLGPPPNYDELLTSAGDPFRPDVYVFDRNFRNPRTTSATIGFEQELPQGVAASIAYTHARTSNLTRFFNRNDAAFGSGDGLGPWSTGLGGGNGIGTLWTVESTARSTYNAVTLGLKRVLDPDLQFQVNYTVSFDKSDDDNERDPFTLRYASATDLSSEYHWSDRDQRHRVNGWFLARLPGDIFLNNRVSYYTAQPVSESCANRGERAATPQDRICTDGTILKRNTLRKDNAFFSWDIRVTRPVILSNGNQIEIIFEVFNVTNTDNFKDPATGSLLFDFNGTVQSGLGDARQAQVGLRYRF